MAYNLLWSHETQTAHSDGLPPDPLTIIFLAGAWHTTFHIQPVLPYLEADGYRVVPVQMHSNTYREPPPTRADDVDQLLQIIQNEVEAGHRICVVGHSVSGQIVSSAVSRFLDLDSVSAQQKAQIVHLIFIACFWDPLRTLADAKWYDIDYDTFWTKLVVPPEEIFYNKMPKEDAKPFADALQVHMASMPPESTDSWRTKVKGTYFVCRKDAAVPLQYQKFEAEENGLTPVEADMDHCPMVSTPKELAEKMNEVLKGLK